MGVATGHAQGHSFEFLLGLLYERAPDRGELESLTKDLPSLIRVRLDSHVGSCGKGPDSLRSVYQDGAPSSVYG
jgi:hypothetical protein